MNRKEALSTFFGYTDFREGQESLISALEEGKDVLGILPTGGGKSLCYQIPGILRDGVTLVISPLISLMMDQVHALNESGIPSAFLNSALTPNQYRVALQRAAQGAYKIIYVAPERLLTSSFLGFSQKIKIGLIAVDEAHCVSQWGQDFRPGYLKIAEFIQSLPERPPIGAFTATATPKVKKDIIQLLELRNPYCRTTGFDRKNLYFAVLHPEQKEPALLRYIQTHPGKSGIIYCNTRKNVEAVCDFLRGHGFPATRYHAGLSEEERRSNQEDFLFDRTPIMVATNAFGMGIDKSNVSFVLHYNMPQSIEAYYQEAGRAGRDGSEAECILFYHPMDMRTNFWLLTHSEPNPALTPEQQKETQEGQLKRLRAMNELCQTSSCIRKYILHYFGETDAADCGKCSNCRETERYKTVGIPTKKGAGSALSEEDEKLFEKLKSIRLLIAQKTNHPAFTIFTDATLLDLVRRKPKTAEEFLSVSGVGQKKQKLYGKVFLAAIHPELIPPKTDPSVTPDSVKKKSTKKKLPEPDFSSSDREWSILEEQLLLRELENGVTAEQARLIHRCTADEIEYHRQKALKQITK